MLIEVRGLHKVYVLGKVKVHALRGVDLSIDRGEYVSIMGPSGSGKSTLMHIIGCLDRPTEGQYLLDGIPMHTLTEPELADIRKKKIGFVFQSFNLLPRITALENVELPMVYAGVKYKERQKRAMELLEQVGLGDRALHRPTELSGGEAQRVAIARALANDPEVILADEPTGNLDSATGEEILDLFDRLHDGGKTVVLVTHDRHVAGRTERIIYLKDGKIVSREEFEE